MDVDQTLHKALDSVNIAIATVDSEGYYLAANRSFSAMLGLTEDQLKGRHWRDITHPDDQERAQEAYAMARSDGRSFANVRALRQDSRQGSNQVSNQASNIVQQALAISAQFGADGAFQGYACIHQEDLSGNRGDQEALTLAVESAPNGLLMLNSAGQIRSVNRAVEKLFGYSRSELVGQTVETLLPARFRARHLRYRDTFNMKAMAGRDLCGLRKDDVEIPLQVYLNRIETGSGELILCTIIDIAERVQYERQLELSKQAAEAANRAKSDFLARMSHEIRTPMNLIVGMNALLLETPLSDKQRLQVEISYRNVRRLLRLINGILDLSKVEAGKVTLEAMPFDLREVLKECAATSGSAMEQKGLKFEVSTDLDVWPYWVGDAERLQQVLLNLIGNAVKFTAQGTIEVRVHSEPGIGTENGLRFEVNDTGCGVPADKTGIIFDAFQQADGSMNRPYEGTGLGLSIARTIVQMMAGRIWVEEKSTPGATFFFTAFFPRASEQDLRNEGGGRFRRAAPDGAGRRARAGGGRQLREHHPAARVPRRVIAVAGLRQQWRRGAGEAESRQPRSDPHGHTDAYHGRVHSDPGDSRVGKSPSVDTCTYRRPYSSRPDRSLGGEHGRRLRRARNQARRAQRSCGRNREVRQTPGGRIAVSGRSHSRASAGVPAKPLQGSGSHASRAGRGQLRGHPDDWTQLQGHGNRLWLPRDQPGG